MAEEVDRWGCLRGGAGNEELPAKDLLTLSLSLQRDPTQQVRAPPGASSGASLPLSLLPRWPSQASSSAGSSRRSRGCRGPRRRRMSEWWLRRCGWGGRQNWGPSLGGGGWRESCVMAVGITRQKRGGEECFSLPGKGRCDSSALGRHRKPGSWSCCSPFPTRWPRSQAKMAPALPSSSECVKMPRGHPGFTPAPPGEEGEGMVGRLALCKETLRSWPLLPIPLQPGPEHLVVPAAKFFVYLAF